MDLFPDVDLSCYAPEDPAILPINYTQAYRDLLAALAFTIEAKEVSERVLLLTEALIEANPMHYTAFEVRRQCLRELPGKDWRQEARRTLALLKESPKNFQLWGHAQAVAQEILSRLEPDAAVAWWLGEHRDGLTEVQGIDFKNYHAWDYRSEVVRGLHSACPWAKVWEAEASLALDLMRQDVRNNSAWSYRAACMRELWGFEPSTEQVMEEVALCTPHVLRAPQSESGWMHLLWLCDVAQEDCSVVEAVRNVCLRHASTSQEDPDCVLSPHAVYVRLELHCKQAEDPDTLRELIQQTKQADSSREPFWDWVLARYEV